MAGQPLANGEDPWAEDNRAECRGRRERARGVQKGQAAAEAAPTAAVAPARLRGSPLCAPPPLPPPSLLPSLPTAPTGGRQPRRQHGPLGPRASPPPHRSKIADARAWPCPSPPPPALPVALPGAVTSGPLRLGKGGGRGERKAGTRLALAH